MKHETAIGAQLAAQGILAKTVKLDMALSEFRNHGGTCREALERVASAFADQGDDVIEFAARTLRAVQLKQDGEEGFRPVADKAGIALPSSPSKERSAGQMANADMASGSVPAAAPQRDGKGRTHDAAKARDPVPIPVSPKKMPGHAKRGIDAIASVQHVIAKSLFDTMKLPDGRSLREVSWGEVPHLASRYSFLTRVMTAIHRRGVPVDASMTLDTLVSEAELKEIIGAVERLNDIH